MSLSGKGYENKSFLPNQVVPFYIMIQICKFSRNQREKHGSAMRRMFHHSSLEEKPSNSGRLQDFEVLPNDKRRRGLTINDLFWGQLMVSLRYLTLKTISKHFAGAKHKHPTTMENIWDATYPMASWNSWWKSPLWLINKCQEYLLWRARNFDITSNSFSWRELNFG